MTFSWYGHSWGFLVSNGSLALNRCRSTGYIGFAGLLNQPSPQLPAPSVQLGPGCNPWCCRGRRRAAPGVVRPYRQVPVLDVLGGAVIGDDVGRLELVPLVDQQVQRGGDVRR